MGGNGFVAAFVGGLVFGSTQRDAAEIGELGERLGELLGLVVWLLVGTLAVGVLDDLTWGMVGFAVLALTVLRMVPVALALSGARLSRDTVAFIGWFGPRGLASIVFGLIALDALPAAEGDPVISIIMLTVLLSVLLHGVTAAPLAHRYGERARRLHQGRPEHQRGRGPAPRTTPGRRTSSPVVADPDRRRAVVDATGQLTGVRGVWGNRAFVHSAEDMSGLPDNTMAFMVTPPPITWARTTTAAQSFGRASRELHRSGHPDKRTPPIGSRSCGPTATCRRRLGANEFARWCCLAFNPSLLGRVRAGDVRLNGPCSVTLDSCGVGLSSSIVAPDQCSCERSFVHAELVAAITPAGGEPPAQERDVADRRRSSRPRG